MKIYHNCLRNDGISSALGAKGTGFTNQVICIFVPKTLASRANKLL